MLPHLEKADAQNCHLQQPRKGRREWFRGTRGDRRNAGDGLDIHVLLDLLAHVQARIAPKCARQLKVRVRCHSCAIGLTTGQEMRLWGSCYEGNGTPFSRADSQRAICSWSTLSCLWTGFVVIRTAVSQTHQSCKPRCMPSVFGLRIASVLAFLTGGIVTGV